MAVVINGTTGVSGVDGSAGTPSYQGTDSNTGIFFPAADTIAFGEGGAEAMRIDSSGNVGIGTTAPDSKLSIDHSSTSTSVLASYANIPLLLQNTSSTDNNWSVIAVQDASGDFSSYIGTQNTSQSSNTAIMAFATNGGSGATERMRIDSSGNVGIGVTPSAWVAGYNVLQVGAASWFTDANANTYFAANTYQASGFVDRYIASQEATKYEQVNGVHIWYTAPSGTAGNAITFTERARITSGGDFLFGANQYGRYSTTYEAFITGRTDENIASAGWSASNSGFMGLTRSGATPCAINRLGDDGDLIGFYQATTLEGSISVSGNTVSYNGFSGGHWTQLPEGRGHNPEILRGTVMSTTGEMCDWKSVVWDEVIEHPAVPAVEAKEAVVDEDGNVVEPAVEAVEGKDAWTETIPHREDYLGQLPVGATFEEDGVTKTVVDDGNERLPKVKISDVVGDKAVYGVFQTWDEVQDMLVTSLGAFVVRIAAGVTVQIGDLLESNGDGCAKVQDDDVIRSKTIGKVTSTTPTATYDDGSYTVPCVIYCG